MTDSSPLIVASKIARSRLNVQPKIVMHFTVLMCLLVVSGCGGGAENNVSQSSVDISQSSSSSDGSSSSVSSLSTSRETALDWDWSSDPKAYCENRPNDGVTPGTFQILRPESSDHLHASEHFVLRWNNDDGVNISQQTIDNALNTLESVWDFYINDLKFPEPYADTSIKYKVSVNVSDQGYASGAGTGERDPEMWVHYDALAHNGTLAHEFAHTLQFTTRSMRDSQYVGWFWESHANWMAHLYNPQDVQCTEALVNAPHIYYGSTRNRYCNWMFFEFLKDNSCPAFVNDAIWRDGLKLDNPARLSTDPFSTLANNAGWNTQQLNDVFSEWALHNIAWDYKDSGHTFRNRYGSYLSDNGARRFRVTRLEPTGNSSEYVVPHYWAPQRWGYNLVQLVPEGESNRITIDFDGVVQQQPAITSFSPAYSLQPSTIANPDSSWQWSVVVLNDSGEPRYSDIQRGASASLEVAVEPGDQSVWLMVMATPKTIHQIFWDQIYYSIYRYPWKVRLNGARPALSSDRESGESLIGAPHPNGGGFVAASAFVSSSAFVGPNALVLGSAQVSDFARIEDFAVVKGQARVSGNARVEGYSLVAGSGRVNGDAVIKGHAAVIGGEVAQQAEVGALSIVSAGLVNGQARIMATMNSITRNVSGSAQLIGDIELNTNIDAGVFYGFIDASSAGDSWFGASRTSPEIEITQPAQ